MEKNDRLSTKGQIMLKPVTLAEMKAGIAAGAVRRYERSDTNEFYPL